jgi:hypothetical protein
MNKQSVTFLLLFMSAQSMISNMENESAMRNPLPLDLCQTKRWAKFSLQRERHP